MAISKIVDRQGNAIIDLSNDTVTPETVAEGKIFHDSHGNVQIGTGNAIEDADGDWDIYNNFYFIDYDGKLLYKYSMQELQNLTELPVPTVEHENLTFDEWNWTLEDLKNESAGIIVGANYHTTDGKDHMKVKAVEDGKSISSLPVYTTGTESVTVDWGDGTTDTFSNISSTMFLGHTYTTAGIYDISINDSYGFLYPSSQNNFDDEYIYPIEINLRKNANLGNINTNINRGGELKISIPSSINMLSIKDYTFNYFYNIIALVLPRTVTNINYENFLYGCYSLRLLSIPKLTETSISNVPISYCSSLKYLTIPDGIETISNDSLFYYCSSLKYIRFPSTLKTCNTAATGFYLKKIILPEGTTSCNLAFTSAEYVIIPSTCASLVYNSFEAVRYLDIGNSSSDISINGNPDVLINRTSYCINMYSDYGKCQPKYYRADYRFGADESKLFPSDTLDFSNWKSSEAPIIDEQQKMIFTIGEILVPADKYEEWRVLNDDWKKLDTLGKLKAV